MVKRFGFVLVLLLLVSALPALAYTVVLKNGKTLKGTLVSEDAEKIVFKDEQGLQYSLKKANLDLDKMKEANVPPPEPPPAAAPASEPEAATPSTAKKSTKVYTTADLTNLREKYGLSVPSTSSGEMVDISTPSGYYKGLMEGVSGISDAMNDLGSMLDGMNTQLEVAVSTGRDPAAEFGKYRSSKAYTEMNKNINASLTELQALRDSMQTPPKGMERGATGLSQAVEALYTYVGAVQQYNGNSPIAAFRVSLQKYVANVDNALVQIQSVPAPPPEPSDTPEPGTEETPNPDEVPPSESDSPPMI